MADEVARDAVRRAGDLFPPKKPQADEFLTPRQVEGEYPFSRAQLTTWRLMGYGPEFIKGPGENGRILYRRSAIERFLDAHTVRTGGEAA